MEPRLPRAAAAPAATVLAWPANALAQVPASSAPVLATSVMQMVFGLVLVIGLLVGSLWLLKRLSAGNAAASGLMRVVSGVAVGPRERVVVVEVGETWLVLGVAPGRVNTLHQLPRAASPAAAPGSAPAGSFRGWLDNALERKHGPR
jgi:flagellar protein FliO/FliZ